MSLNIDPLKDCGTLNLPLYVFLNPKLRIICSFKGSIHAISLSVSEMIENNEMSNQIHRFSTLSSAEAPYAVLSISFEVDVPTGKVGGSLLFECRRHEFLRGVWGHAPPENFEI